MRKLLLLSTAALIGASSIQINEAEARSRRHLGTAVAAGIAGLAIGGILGAAASNAYAYPAYGYGYPYAGYGYPAYGYGYGYAPVIYRPARVVYRQPAYAYGYDYGYAPVIYRTRRVYYPAGYGYWGGPISYGW